MILVGDLNSGIARHNEPEQPGDDLAFMALAGFGMKDNGAVQSCCYSDLFDPAATFDHTVDHVLSKPGLKTVRAVVTGNKAGERTPSGSVAVRPRRSRRHPAAQVTERRGARAERAPLGKISA